MSAADPAALGLAAAALRRGELIAIPTETVYGLVALPQAAPLERLLAAKRRSPDKGIQLLVDSVEQAAAMAVLPAAAVQLARAFWPGALTLVLERRPGIDLSPLLSGGRPTLGVRLPDHDVPRALARLLGPLAASSANIATLPPATTASAVAAALADLVSLIVDGGPARGGVASTVVDCTLAQDRPRILRQGAIPAAEIFRALGQEYTDG